MRTAPRPSPTVAPALAIALPPAGASACAGPPTPWARTAGTTRAGTTTPRTTTAAQALFAARLKPSASRVGHVARPATWSPERTTGPVAGRASPPGLGRTRTVIVLIVVGIAGEFPGDVVVHSFR
ncbi:MAG: hypothetical protein ACKOGA_16890, partial [Planctomycetaceae bacterium]